MIKLNNPKYRGGYQQFQAESRLAVFDRLWHATLLGSAYGWRHLVNPALGRLAAWSYDHWSQSQGYGTVRSRWGARLIQYAQEENHV